MSLGIEDRGDPIHIRVGDVIRWKGLIRNFIEKRAIRRWLRSGGDDGR